MDWVLAALCAELALAWGGFVALRPLVRLSSPPAVYALAPLSVCVCVCVSVCVCNDMCLLMH